MLSYSFTGTSKQDPTDAQMVSLAEIMVNELGLLNAEGFFWNFGDCIHADKVSFDWVSNFFALIAVTRAFPGNDPTRRAYCRADRIADPAPMLDRNHVVANLGVNGLFAMPRNYSEIWRSGTWATIRHAYGLHRPIWVIKPDGVIWRDFRPSLNLKQLCEWREE